MAGVITKDAVAGELARAFGDDERREAVERLSRQFKAAQKKGPKGSSPETQCHGGTNFNVLRSQVSEEAG